MLHGQEQEPLDYALKVSIDVQSSKVEGVASIRLRAGEKILLQKGPLRIRDVHLNGKSVKIREQDGAIPITALRPDVLRIRYEGIFRPHGATIGQEPLEYASVIDEQGISLTGIWYPKVISPRLCRYQLTATLPRGFEAVSEADVIQERIREGKGVFTFRFPYPLDEITLVASDQYKVATDRFGGVDILAYFFQADAELAQTYIEQTKRYLKLYGDMLGPYPYKRFSIVENILPTGYSMPTFTLLGQEVVRLPFIPQTSLGHEVLHQWFGNLVYIDYAKGNWAEGLTTYLADHLFEEQKNAGAAYRKALLIDYQSYVHEGNEFPLADFRGRTDYASKAIGYGKAAMVFHMLKKSLGNDIFLKSLRYFIGAHRHQRASWEDLQEAFEKGSGKDLAWFFKQWVHEKGLPDLSPEDSHSIPKYGAWETSAMLVQWERPYILDVPMTLTWNGGKKAETCHVEEKRTRLSVDTGPMPEKISVDREYDVARRLSRQEFPPVIARLLGSEKTLLVPSQTGAGIYREVIDAFLQRGVLLKDAASLTDADLASASLILMGVDNPIARQLFGVVKADGGSSISVRENPFNPSHVAAIVHGSSQEEVTLAFDKMFHYGRYSHAAFEHGRNISKGVNDTESGITREVIALPQLDQSTRDTLAKIIAQVATKKIVYVGESHDRFSDHLVELEVIKALHRQGRTIAIGMEMFQRPAQQALDDYIAGKIDERQFLKGSRYFAGWGFDYNLYRPILEYARAEGIPVVALNTEQEIVSKVFHSGLNSLFPEEKAKIPARLDLSDKAYEERLRKVFKEHEAWREERFDFFYQAQVVWDETMAESVSDFLKTHPAYQMVVLAGSGHLAYGSGIPGRVARTTRFQSTIILNGPDIEKDAADYVLSPQAVTYTPAPKLMVFLTEESGKVMIKSFPEGSISEKAGMKAGDVIRSIDDVPIRSIDDGKIELLFHKKGDTINVGVLRKEPSGEEKGLEFQLIL
ncbi:MAG TPA: ChaN family lipoprotein [Syntrophorhabdales bacterium]|nr:ChaN family lipoprotein [Syntrophorhabdales bacterium]